MAPPSLSISQTHFPQPLFHELSSVVEGPICRRLDSEFIERSKTFNGKLNSPSRIVVSPLNAQDVSTVVRFCTRNGLSLSVRAGGYGIAGWSVAGDVIIDLSKLKEVDIEAPIANVEGEKNWIRLVDMPPPGNKGKGRASTVHLKASGPSAEAAPPPATLPPSSQHAEATHATTTAPVKRRHQDRDDTPPDFDGERKRNRLNSYDAASQAVASFLHGPPLPYEKGEKPRDPPVDRHASRAPQPSNSQVEKVEDLQLSVLEPSSRQASNTSSSSAEYGSGMSDTSSARNSIATTVTAPSDDSPRVDSTGRTSLAQDRGAEPFGYITSNTSSVEHPPMYSSVHPFGSTFSSSTGVSGVTAVTAWRSPFVHTSGPWSGVGVLPPVSTHGLGATPAFGLTPGAASQLGNLAPAGPVHPHAYVTFGAGVRQKELDMYTAEHKLEGISGITGEREEGVVPYHLPSSAHPVGSSIMILGGFGFLSRMYGLSVDNVVEIEMVLADGRIVVVNAEDDPDLWWAVRGAGPAFGIATRYKARAFPVPVVFAGNLIYRFHRATAPSLIKHFRDCIKAAPRELYANVLLTAGPADKDSLVVIQMCYVGPKKKGMEYLQAISSWDGERCLLNEVNEKSFLNQQDSVAQVLRGRVGRQWFIRSALISSLPDEVIHKTVLQFADTPIGCTWIFELAGGAIADFEDNCIPKAQREAAWTVAALHQWEMGIDDPRCVTSAEDWMRETISMVALGGPYPTFIGRHEPPSRVMACYGDNWSRLAELKRKYDPNHVFRHNFWPLDENGQPVEPLYNEPPSP